MGLIKYDHVDFPSTLSVRHISKHQALKEIIKSAFDKAGVPSQLEPLVLAEVMENDQMDLLPSRIKLESYLL